MNEQVFGPILLVHSHITALSSFLRDPQEDDQEVFLNQSSELEVREYVKVVHVVCNKFVAVMDGTDLRLKYLVLLTFSFLSNCVAVRSFPGLLDHADVLISFAR